MDSPKTTLKHCNNKNYGFKAESIQCNKPIRLRYTTLQTMYSGTVNIPILIDNDILYLESYDSNIHVKIIDYTEHNLSEDITYTLSYLNALSPAKYKKEINNLNDVLYHSIEFFKFIRLIPEFSDFQPGIIFCICNVPHCDNAYYNGRYMVFGNGNTDPVLSPRGISTNAYSSACIVAHELMHLVLHHAYDLVYEKETGALNESIADCTGVSYELHIREKNKKCIGFEIGSELSPDNIAIRSMQNPYLYKQPIYVNGLYWHDPLDISIDNGGVHINSGVSNHAFYKLCQKIPMIDALKIFIKCMFKIDKRYGKIFQFLNEVKLNCP